MDHPSLAEFEAAARREGYDEVAERSWPANAEVATHEHPFAVKAIVVAGEMWLTHDGSDAAPARRRPLRARRARCRMPSATAPREPPTGRRAGTRRTEGRAAAASRSAQTAMSLDWMRLTPALVILSQAALSEPLRSMPRDASSITAALKPALRASSAVQATQKSVARPQT